MTEGHFLITYALSILSGLVLDITDFNSSKLNLKPLYPSIPRVTLSLAHDMKEQGRCDHARYVAGEVLVLTGKHKEYADTTVAEIKSYKIIAVSHYAQGSMFDAELSQRCATRLVKDAWGGRTLSSQSS
jgi:hypothetical protein